MAKFNSANIEQWIADLSASSGEVKYNADYACVTDADGSIMGDAALFLAIRHADIKENEDIYAWYDDFGRTQLPPGGYHPSEVIITRFTGIPLEDACKLIWSPLLFDDSFPEDKMTAKLFVEVLKTYLRTGDVDWRGAVS